MVSVARAVRADKAYRCSCSTFALQYTHIRRPLFMLRYLTSAHAAWRLGCRTALLLTVVLGARTVVAQPTTTGGLSGAALDSVLVGLQSADWNERHGALLRANTAYPTEPLPLAIAELVVRLLAREASATVGEDGREDFGEYIVDLVLTGVRTADVRTIPSILVLDGLGISSGVAAFVASQGASMLPALDALARTRDDRASDVVETYALMYARYGSRLNRADSVQVLRRLVGAASDTSSVVRSQLAHVASRGPIPELRATVADLAASDPELWNGFFVVRRDAAAALPTVERAHAAVGTRELLNRLALLTEGACDGASGRLQGQCAALAAHLATAVRSVVAGQPRPAENALDAYRRTAQRLGADELVPRLTAVTLTGTAQAVIDRL